MRLHLRIDLNQWALPLHVWWWPVTKDLAFGVHVGPVHLMWICDREWGKD